MIKLGKKKSGFLVGLVATMLTLIGSFVAADEPLKEKDKPEIKQTKFLVLDSRIIDKTIGATLTLGKIHKSKYNPLFKEDKPWEPRFDNLYPNVLYDDQDNLYKCWYSPFIIDDVVKETPREKHSSIPYRPKHRETGVCYTFSKDGIHWEKPELGIVEFDGSKKNNIVFRAAHGAGIFIDSRETEPWKRFKMFTRDESSVDLAVAFSPDGLHWSRLLRCPEINPVPVDGTHYNALWVPELGEWVGFTRLRGLGAEKRLAELGEKKRRIRQVGRTTSKDFLTWKQAELVFQGLTNHLQIYEMPVFRYKGTYLGLPVIFNTETDRAHTELAWSPDTIKWHRISPGVPLIANGSKRGDYDWGCVYPAAYPIFLEGEIRLYYGASNGPHFGWRDGFFCLATLRPDGWAGYEPTSKDTPGIITTKPVTGRFASLRITADVEAGGSVCVAVVNRQGKELVSSEPVNTTVTDGKVIWKGGWDVAALSGERIRLKFVLKNAKLYAFQIQ